MHARSIVFRVHDKEKALNNRFVLPFKCNAKKEAREMGRVGVKMTSAFSVGKQVGQRKGKKVFL